jgi:hemoglobin-like flavoprotein
MSVDHIMTPKQIKTVHESFQKLIPIVSEVGEAFYAKLFEIAPETRELFSHAFGNRGNKAQVISEVVNRHLRSMLTRSVTNTRVAISPAMRELGRRHVQYNITPVHFAKMKEALIWTLEQKLGDDFPPEVNEVWSSAFDNVALMMQQAITESESPETADQGCIFARIANQANDLPTEDTVVSIFRQRLSA